jgi:hypothetical protein
MNQTIVRRDFLKCALASAVVIPALGAAEARATDLPPLDPTDPVAQSSDAAAGCGIYAGHSVPSRGWCRAFSQRA